MKIKIIAFFVVALIILGLFGALYIVEERKVIKKESDMLALQNKFMAEKRQMNQHMASILSEQKKHIGMAVSLFARDLLDPASSEKLNGAVRDAIISIPIDELVVLDAEGTVLATSNLKYSGQNLDERGLKEALQKKEPGHLDGFWYFPVLRQGEAVGAVRIK